jgi:hypothetical protein
LFKFNITDEFPYFAGADGSLAHGPNSVISMMHHAFETYGLGEIDCSLHADNCGGMLTVIHNMLLFITLKEYTKVEILQF